MKLILRDQEPEIFGRGDLKNGIWPNSTALWMTAIYLALFIIRPWEQLFPSLAVIRFEKVYAILMIIVVAFSSRKRIEIRKTTVFVLLFFISLIVSAVFGYNSSQSSDGIYEYFTLILFYLILMAITRTAYDLAFIILTYIGTMTVYLFKSQWEFFVNGQHRYDQGVVRLVGIENTFGGPNSLAMSILVSIPILWFVWKHKDWISEGWSAPWKKRLKYGIWSYAILALTSIILTNSRSGILGLVLSISLVVLKMKSVSRKFLMLLVAILLIGITWTMLSEEHKGRYRTIWDPESGPENAQVSAEGRVSGFHAGVAMFDRFPLSGVGIGNFLDYRVTHLDGIPLQAHNLAGQMLGETGLIGSITFLSLVFVILLNCTKSVPGLRTASGAGIKAMVDLRRALRDSVIILIFEGLFGHNLFRFNWLWIAAFSQQAYVFLKTTMSSDTKATNGQIV